MIVEVDGIAYKCSWEGWGFSYVCPVIKIRRFYCFGLLIGWRKWSRDAVVNDRGNGGGFLAKDVDRMTPDEMRSHFRRVIKKQIAYYKAWEEDRVTQA